MSDEEDTPFEQFDEDVGDREGDPFDSFGDPTDEESDEGGDNLWVTDNEEQLGGESPDTQTPAAEPAAADSGTQPADEHASFPETGDQVGESSADEGVSEMGERKGDPFESAERAFERMDVGDLDVDDVWDTLSDAEQRGSVTESQGRTYAEVSKHSYCEHCEYFSAPPDVSCSHDGTEILEFLDLETVRLVDCPVVAERRELEDNE